MTTIEISGERAKIIFSNFEVVGFPQQSSYFGGYDCSCEVNVTNSNFSASAKIWTSTGELYLFGKELQILYTNLNGVASYRNPEEQLSLEISANNSGNWLVKGEIVGDFENKNRLIFEFATDQSYFVSTNDQFQILESKYGGMSERKS